MCREKDSQLQRHVADKTANAALLTAKNNTITSLKQDIAAHRTRIDKLEQQNATLERDRLTDDRLHQCGSAAEIKSIAARAGEEMVRLAGFKRRAEALHDQREREEDESDRMCVACKYRERTVALPCGHVCFCEECYRRVLSGPPERADDGGDEDEEFEEEPTPKCAICRKTFSTNTTTAQPASVASGGGASVRTSAAGTAGPQPSGSQQQRAANTTAAQRASDIDAFIEMPSGAWYCIVTPGTGRVPTLNDRVKYDYIAWFDGDGRDQAYDNRGQVDRVSDFPADSEREALLSMREGEVRQIRMPDDRYFVPYVQLRLISILHDSDDFTVMASGARYRIVTEGTGRVPTLNDRVKYDCIAWRDAFDGQDKFYDLRGAVRCVSDFLTGVVREAVLSMREGEVRQIITSTGYADRYHQLHLVSIE